MALKKQTFQVLMGKGVQEAIDERVLPSPHPRSLVNVEFDKDGALNKRKGYVAMSTTVTGQDSLGTCWRLAKRRDELLYADGEYLYTYGETVDGWYYRDLLPATGVDSIVVSREANSTSGPHMPDCAVVGDYLLVVWRVYLEDVSYYKIAWQAIDLANQNRIKGQGILDHGSSSNDAAPRVVNINDTTAVIAFYANGTSTIEASTWTKSAPTTVTTPATIGSGVTTPNYFDIVSNGTDFYLFHRNGTTLQLQRYNTSLAQQATRNVATSTYYVGYSVATGGTYAHIAYWDNNLNYMYWEDINKSTLAMVNSNSFSTGTGTLSRLATVEKDSSNILICWVTDKGTTYGDNSDHSLEWRWHDGAGALNSAYSSTSGIMGGVEMYGKPVTHDTDGEVYIHLSGLQQYYDGYALCKFRSDSPDQDEPQPLAVAHVYHGKGTSHYWDFYMNEPELYNDQIWCACTVVQSLTVAGVTGGSNVYGRAGVNCFGVDINPRDANQFLEIGSLTVFGGGVVRTYDGNSVVSAGFLNAPRIIDVSDTGAGSAIAAATYYYVATHEWWDMEGHRHISQVPVGAPYEYVVSVDTDQIDIEIKAHSFHDRSDAEALEAHSQNVTLWRSNAGAGSGPFYYITSARVDPYNATHQIYTVSDTNGTLPISGQEEQNYWLGNLGALSYDPPPPARVLCKHQQRIWAAAEDEHGVLYYSNRYTTALAGEGRNLQFPVANFVPVEPGIKITGMASLDDKLIVFTKDSIYMVFGEGPAETGFPADGFSKPRKIASGFGCVDHRSVVVTPQGVLFRSRYGFARLGRDTQVATIGSPIEDTADGYPEVVSVVLLEKKEQVRWLCYNSAFSDYRAIVYDYVKDRWTVFNMGLSAPTDWINYKGDCYVGNSTKALYEDQSTYSDDGTSYNMEIISPWVKFGEMNTFKRVWRVVGLGEHVDDHDLTVSLAYNFNDSWVSVYNYDETETAGWGPPYRWRIHVPRQKCQAICVKIEDVDPAAGASAAFVLNSLGFEFGLQEGLIRGPHAEVQPIA